MSREPIFLIKPQANVYNSNWCLWNEHNQIVGPDFSSKQEAEDWARADGYTVTYMFPSEY